MNTRSMILASLFAALLAVSSYIAIPIGPVPHTLQIFFIFLAGLVLGGRWGAISVAVWVIIGLFGLPVFAHGKAGIAVLVGPTGGFLIGFITCAYIVGWFFENRKLNKMQIFLVIMLGLVVVYSLGLLGFMASFKYFLNKPMSWEKAASLAVLPFLPFDIVKAAGAAYIGEKLKNALLKAGLNLIPHQ